MVRVAAATRVRRNAVQKSLVSESPTAHPNTSRRPSADTPGGDDHGRGDHPGALAVLSPPTRALQYVASKKT